MVTIYDIAKACHVAPATVSKALNNYAGVNQKTKALIVKTAEKMNYVPNSMARYLNIKQSFNVGMLIYISDEFPNFKHQFYLSIMDSFRAFMERNKYDLTLLSKNMEGVKDSFLNHCRLRQVDGVLIIGDFSDEKIQELINSGIPCVCFDYYGDKATGVYSDNYEKMFELTNYLIKLGHKDIVFIHGEAGETTTLRSKAYKDALKASGIEFKDTMMLSGEYCNYQLAYKYTKDLLLRTTPPTAIMYADDHSALGGVAAIEDMGLKVPDDVSITGFDGIELANVIRPRLTTIKQNADEIGIVLGKKLLEAIKDPDNVNFEQIKVSAEFIQGGSCRRV